LADGNDLAARDPPPLRDQDLAEDRHRGRLPREGARDRDERLHEGGAAGIDRPEHRADDFASDEDVEELRAHLDRVVERAVELGARGFALWTDDALLDDLREVPILERDDVEASLRPGERVGEAELRGTRKRLADELAEISLPRDEAHDRRRPVGRLRLDELRKLLRLAMDEVLIPRVRRKPEDELIEEEHDGIVAELARVPAHDREALIERQERLARVANHRSMAGKEARDEILNEPRAKIAPPASRHRAREALPIPERRLL